MSNRALRSLFVAIGLSSVGSFLAIFGELLVGPSTDFSLGWEDAAGLALAFTSFSCIAFYILCIRAIGAKTECNTPDAVVVF